MENGEASIPFPVTTGLKQGCVLAPTLFSLLFAQMLDFALSQSTVGVSIHYWYDGDFFNLSRLQSRTKASQVTVRDFLFADDCALAANSEKDLQELAICFMSAAKACGLTVSKKKTEVLMQLAPNATCCPLNITMDGEALKNVDVFKCLGSSINSAANLDDEILNRLSKASQTFERLHTRVWQEWAITVNTKLDVYKVVVLSSLLYGCETWTCYRRHIKKLEQFHLRCLHKILRVGWDAHIRNQEIVHCTKMLGIEAHLKKAQLRWCRHVACMKDYRRPKQLFFAELSQGKRHMGGQNKRYKDTLKASLKTFSLPTDRWQNAALNHVTWGLPWTKVPPSLKGSISKAWMINVWPRSTESSTLGLL